MFTEGVRLAWRHRSYALSDTSLDHSLVPQRHQRINFCSAMRRQITSEQGNEAQQQGNHAESQWVSRAYTVKQLGEQSRLQDS